MYIRRKAVLYIYFVLILTIFLSFGVDTILGQDGEDSVQDDYPISNKVVMIIADHLDLDSLKSSNYINNIINKSYLGLISNRQLGKPSAYKAKLILGAGDRLEIDNSMLNAETITISSEEAKAVSYSDLEKLTAINENSEYLYKIGYIGDVLEKSNLKSGMFGNSDTETVNRSSAIITMNSKGYTAIGNVDDVLKEDIEFPGGKRTDYKKLEELYKQFLPACSFMVIDIGDTNRLETYKSTITEEQYLSIKEETLNSLNDFLMNLIEGNNEAVTFIILSSYPSKDNIKENNRMTPIIVYTGESRGTLYSDRTRRNGIIVNTDVADYVLHRLGLKSNNSITEIYSDKAYQELYYINRSSIRVSKLRLPTLTSYALYEITSAIMVSIYLICFKYLKSSILEYICRLILLSNMIAPLVLLFMSFLEISTALSYISVFFISIFLLSIILKYVSNKTLALLISITMSVVVSLSTDIVLGGNLIKKSVLGYDPIIGARFYGIGNELAGVFIGSSILFACSIVELYKNKLNNRLIKLIIIFYFILCTAISGLPFWGANFGGTIAAIAGYFFTYVYLFKIKINKYSIAAFAGIILSVALGILFIDLFIIDSSSHIARFAVDIKQNGILVLLSTVSRKLSMNLKLIRYTIWTKVLISLLFIILVMFFRPVRILKKIFVKYRSLTAAWIGIATAGVTGLFVNDSGIVMAATSMIYMGYTMLLICLEELSTDTQL